MNAPRLLLPSPAGPASKSRPPRLLIVTRHTPLPWEDGAGAYLHDLARFLATHGFRVEILWLAAHDHLRWQRCWRLPEAFDASIRLRLPGAIRLGRRYFFPGTIWYPWKARMLHRARQFLTAVGFSLPRRVRASLPPPAPRPWMSPPTPDEFAVTDDQVRAFRPAIVMVSYAWLCPLFDRPALRAVQPVCLTHDVAWQRARLAAAAAGQPPAITAEVESAWLRSAGTIIAITETDAAELRRLAPAVHVLVAPKAGVGPPLDSGPDLAAHRLLFVGSDNPFNAEGLAWFLLAVWPLVRAAVPGTSIDICGTIDRVVSLRPAGVRFHGSVPDLAPFYRDAAVVVVPLLHTSGLNIKLVDAAAAGRAIVTSAVTLTGAPFLRGAVLSADTAAGFAGAVHLLLTDAAANTNAAAAALRAVRQHLSPAACYGPLTTRLLPAR